MTSNALRFLKGSLVLPFVCQGAFAETLTLQQYRDLVHQKSPSWQAAQNEAQGSELLKNEADGLTSVQLISQMSFLDDQRPTTNPNFQGTKTQNTAANFGFRQQTDVGINWSLTHNINHTHIFEATVLPIPEFYDAFPKLELSVPLWRNWLGAEISSKKSQISQQALLRQRQGQISLLKNEIETDIVYFGLRTQQQILDTQKDSLMRAERILQWTRSRIQKNLADPSDIYQSQAVVAARKMDLEVTEKNLTEAAARFNSRIGQIQSPRPEALQDEALNLESLNLNLTPERHHRELELKKLAAHAAADGHRSEREKYKPNLDLNLVASTQGRDVTLSDADARVFKDDKTYLLLALNFSMPLNQAKQSHLREGYEKLSMSQSEAALDVDRNLSVTWESTVQQAKQLKNQLAIAQELESLQKSKANAERDKFNRGRSTLFQVLLYEQDYLSARIQRINLEFAVRQFISQLALFE